MRTKDFNIRDLIYDLRGTCSSIPESLPEGMKEGDLTDDERDTLDSAIFICSVCGWWCDMDEWDCKDEGELVCNNCTE